VLKDVVKGNYGSMIVLPELPGKMEILCLEKKYPSGILLHNKTRHFAS
jgi:hypothetical protein